MAIEKDNIRDATYLAKAMKGKYLVFDICYTGRVSFVCNNLGVSKGTILDIIDNRPNKPIKVKIKGKTFTIGKSISWYILVKPIFLEDCI